MCVCVCVYISFYIITIITICAFAKSHHAKSDKKLTLFTQLELQQLDFHQRVARKSYFDYLKGEPY